MPEVFGIKMDRELLGLAVNFAILAVLLLLLRTLLQITDVDDLITEALEKAKAKKEL